MRLCFRYSCIYWDVNKCGRNVVWVRVNATKIFIYHIRVSACSNQLGLRLRISPSYWVHNIPPSTWALSCFSRFPDDSMSLIFPDKTVDFVLKALRKCPGSFLKLILSFKRYLTTGEIKGGGGGGGSLEEVRTEISGKLSLNIVQRVPDSFSHFKSQSSRQITSCQLWLLSRWAIWIFRCSLTSLNCMVLRLGLADALGTTMTMSWSDLTALLKTLAFFHT